MSGSRLRFRLRRRLRRDLAEAPLARRRAPVVLLTLVACVCSGIGGAQPESEEVSVVCFVPLTAGEIDQHNVTYFGHANPGEA
jgi:hypothetical protein